MGDKTEIPGLVGRYVRVKDVRKEWPIEKAYLDNDNGVRVTFGDLDNPSRHWTAARLSHERFELLPPDWQPPEQCGRCDHVFQDGDVQFYHPSGGKLCSECNSPEGVEEPKAEVDALAEELWRFHKDSTCLGINSASERIAAEAAKIRALVRAELPEIEFGVKIVHKNDAGSYCSVWAGGHVEALQQNRAGVCVGYAEGEWTESPPDARDLTVCPDYESAMKLAKRCGWTKEHWARCVYIPGNNPCGNVISNYTDHARAVMLIEEPRPVSEAEKTLDELYGQAAGHAVEYARGCLSRKAERDADEVRELEDHVRAQSTEFRKFLGMHTQRSIVCAALAWFRAKGKPVRCTAKDLEERALQLRQFFWDDKTLRNFDQDIPWSIVGTSSIGEVRRNAWMRLAMFFERQPVRVCTVSDEELGAKLMVLYGDSEIDEGFAAVGRKAKQLLGAVDVDAIVYGTPPRVYNTATKRTWSMNIGGDSALIEEIQGMYHRNQRILLAENWELSDASSSRESTVGNPASHWRDSRG